MKQLPLGVAYAIWVGIGVIGTSVVSMWLFGEPLSATKIASIVLIAIGIAGLKA
jgi:quaternary ammonium compound-resistance protein SugE